MSTPLRNWKCRHCGYGNTTEIPIDGAGTCTHCFAATQVQPSRMRDGVLLPASYPTRPRPPVQPAPPNRSSNPRPLR